MQLSNNNRSASELSFEEAVFFAMVAVISYTWKTDPYKEDEDKYKVP